MSEQTFASRGPLNDGLPADPRFRKQAQALSRLAYRYRWPLGAVGMLVVATIVMEWARARPGYDPYGWLVWGHLTLHWKLDTNGAPSWKPLPYLFTVPYALFGKHALQLWMITAFAFSLSGLVFAWRVAFWLVDAPPERRYAAYAAGLVAALAVLGIDIYIHSILSAESDTMIVALCLAAVDCIICRRYRWAFWAWRSVPAMRRQMIIGIVLIPLLWLGIPALTSKSPFSAASLAERSPRALHGNKITGTFDRFLSLTAAPVKLAALIATGFAVVRRDRPVLLLAGGVALWVIVEAAFALHGWPAVPRYMYEAAAGVCVLAGVFVGRVILDARSMLAWAHVRVSPRVAGWAAAAVVAIFAVSVVPAAHERITAERYDLTQQRARTAEIGLLASVVKHLGGAKILACGQPNIGIAWQSILAWDLGTNTGVLYFSRKAEAEHHKWIENMYPHSYGWQFFPGNGIPNSSPPASCKGLTFNT